MFKKSRFVLICVICLFISVISVYAQETLTITTYYPSPYGVYREMRAQRMAIGNTWYNGTTVCWEPDSCTYQIGTDSWDPDTDLVVEGNVGIGTTGPVSLLHLSSGTESAAKINLQDTSSAGTRGGSIYGSWGANGLILNTLQGDSATHLYYGHTDAYVDQHHFYVNGAEKVTINNQGNVGIGTTGPGGTLDVNGTIYQRGALLHADYVFEPEYKLESIEEHAAYMWQNKHLKAVPKAKQDEQGKDMVEIGAQNRGVLEELEKAHVYIQQLNERIKVLEMKLSKLER